MTMTHEMNLLFLQKARKTTYSDLFLGLLVPALLFRLNRQELALSLVAPSSLMLLVASKMNSLFVFSVGAYTYAFIVSLLEAFFSLIPILIIGFVLCSTCNLLKLFPGSFTIGEALIISHLSAVFIQTSSIFCIAFVTLFLIERYSIPCSIYSLLIIVFLLTFCLFVVCSSSPTLLLLYKLQAKRALCYLSISNILLLLFWLTVFLGCVSIIWIYRTAVNNNAVPNCVIEAEKDSNCGFTEIDSSSPPNFTDANKQSQLKTDKTFAMAKTPFWIRKVFHFAAGLVYATGLFWSPRLLALASLGLLALFILFEWIRRRGPKDVSQLLSSMVDPFRDERDSGELIFTPIALLLGLSLPLWWRMLLKEDSTIELGNLCAVPKLHPAVWSGVLSIAVGDSMAALVGRAWGRRRWPGTHRTFLGSVASFLSQLVVWMLIAWHEKIPWTSGLIPIVTGVLVEAYVEQIDNLIVPIVVMIVFPNPLPV